MMKKKMELKELKTFLKAVNIIWYRALNSYIGLLSIELNEHRNASVKLPYELEFLYKSHYHIYIIEVYKLINGGDDHFHLNKLMNSIKTLFDDVDILNLRARFKSSMPTIKKIKFLRKNFFAHLDEEFIDLDRKMELEQTNLSVDEMRDLNLMITELIVYANERLGIDDRENFKKWADCKISDFYDAVFKKLVIS